MPIGRSNSSLVFHRNFRRISRGFELGAIAHVLFVSSLKTLVESRDCLISSGSRLELGCICACAHLSGVPPSHSRRRNGGRSSTTQSPWEHQTPKTKKSLSFFSGIVPVFDLCMVRSKNYYGACCCWWRGRRGSCTDPHAGSQPKID